ncbi:MAG: T9SS type A sorting domain-containing protein [Ignavibacteria bacterium]|nr:T9SS type A sorting domain-containing protein [Ignavibacteria bacterium]
MNLVASTSNIPHLTDTISPILMVPLTQPTVTRLGNGWLVSAFTTFLRNNVQTVDNGDQVNAGEIFTSISTNGGSTWSTPVNQTNTPAVEEKHPSFGQTTSDSLRLYYVRDLKAGGWVNVPDWGKAPVYGIFKKAPVTVGIKDNVSIAKSYELFQNYPNPFNPTTTISYFVQKSGLVTLKVYDALGREVASLVNEIQSQGPKEVTFIGDKLSSGIYYYSISAGDFKDTKKMMLIK